MGTENRREDPNLRLDRLELLFTYLLTKGKKTPDQTSKEEKAIVQLAVDAVKNAPIPANQLRFVIESARAEKQNEAKFGKGFTQRFCQLLFKFLKDQNSLSDQEKAAFKVKLTKLFSELHKELQKELEKALKNHAPEATVTELKEGIKELRCVLVFGPSGHIVDVLENAVAPVLSAKANRHLETYQRTVEQEPEQNQYENTDNQPQAHSGRGRG